VIGLEVCSLLGLALELAAAGTDTTHLEVALVVPLVAADAPPALDVTAVGGAVPAKPAPAADDEGRAAPSASPLEPLHLRRRGGLSIL
jgi:hypothetical protein